MKESEAKKKQCPYMKIDAAVGAVRQTTIRTCQGSDCMMWDFDQAEELREIAGTDDIPEGWNKKHNAKNHKNIIVNRYVDSDSGDCGLKTKELYCEGCNQ